MRKVKYIFYIFLTLLVSSPTSSQVFDGAQSAFGDIFFDLVDPNEGLTSFRSLYIPSGGRAESMGSAFTALANDISFFDYNAAASSTLKETELAVFHNAWIADSAVETLSFTQRHNNLGYGASLKAFYVPFTEYNILGSRVSNGYYSETMLTLNVAYNFLAGYDFKGLAVGLNFKGGYRSVPDYADDNTNTVIEGSGLAQSSIAGMVDLGIQMRFDFNKHFVSREPNVYVGLAMNNIGLAVTGFGKEIQPDAPLPTRLALGVAYRPFLPVVLSLEFQQPINLQSISDSEQWSVGAGTHVTITEFFATSAGFLLRGANPRFSLGAEFLVNFFAVNINYTLDLTTSINPVNRFSLGAKFSLGDRGRKAKQDIVDGFYQQGLQFYAAGDLESAIVLWEKALELDPSFDPVKKALAVALETQMLQDRILDIQLLD